jgi:hypothetical protein
MKKRLDYRNLRDIVPPGLWEAEDVSSRQAGIHTG